MKHLRNSSPTGKVKSLSLHVHIVLNRWSDRIDAMCKICLVVNRPNTSPTSAVVTSYILSGEISMHLNPTLKCWIIQWHILWRIFLQLMLRRPPNWRSRTTCYFSSNNQLHSLRNLKDEHRVDNVVACMQIWRYLVSIGIHISVNKHSHKCSW